MKNTGKVINSFGKVESIGLQLTIWRYLIAQVTTPMQDEAQSAKHERVYNFLHVPQKLEKVFKSPISLFMDQFLVVIFGIFYLSR